MKQPIKDAFGNFMWFFRSNYKKVSRVLYFLPIIWRGYDFDYSYAVELFKKQLERTAKFMESENAIGTDAKNKASKIRTAINLLDKVYDEVYGCEYQDKLIELYGEDVLEWVFTPVEDGSGSYLNHAFEYWDNAEEVQKMHDKFFEESKAKQKKAEDLVWRYIGHNIRGWWD